MPMSWTLTHTLHGRTPFSSLIENWRNCSSLKRSYLIRLEQLPRPHTSRPCMLSLRIPYPYFESFLHLRMHWRGGMRQSMDIIWCHERHWNSAMDGLWRIFRRPGKMRSNVPLGATTRMKISSSSYCTELYVNGYERDKCNKYVR